MSDLLIVKAKPGIDVNPDLMRYWCNEILKQKETGVVVLPWFLNVVVAPEDVEVQIIDPKNSKFERGDRNVRHQTRTE